MKSSVQNKKIIAGNWKMNPRTMAEAVKLYSAVGKGVGTLKKTEVIMCPPFLYTEKLKNSSRKISLGAQDAFAGDVGPFTGEISAEMLYLLGVRYVILGHSERRALGESSADINKKIKGALASGLRPILCVGEAERDEDHAYYNFIKNQLEECLAGVSKNSISKIIIAYEPIWAISTTPDRRDATPDDSREMAIFIRKVLVDKFNKDAHLVRILYGGSVNEKDAGGFLKDGGVDGLLVGRASLDAKKFTEIVKTCETLNK